MAVDAVYRIYRKARRRQLAVVALLICELSLLALNARAMATGQEGLNPLDKSLPLGALRPMEASPGRFNATVPLRFRLKGAEFDRTVTDVILRINDARVAARRIKISAHKLATDVRLTDGANKISLRAYDAIGRTLYYNETLWCGNWTLKVELVNADGTPVRDVSTISVVLPGDDTVRQQQITNLGSATFKNLPAQKIIITARAASGPTTVAEAFGSAGAVRIELQNSSTPNAAADDVSEAPTTNIH
jgi:hypothetical protein